MLKTQVPAKAAILGYSGVIPFAAAVAMVAFGDDSLGQMALEGFLVYAAVILSFLGGIRWGAASISDQEPGLQLIFAVLPSLWAAFFVWWFPAVTAIYGLMTGFIIMGFADSLYPAPRVAAWMAPLRLRLTVGVVACHLVILSVI